MTPSNRRQRRAAASIARRLRRAAASQYLLETWGISRTPNTLAKLAVTGGGPVFEKDGRIPLYTEPALDDWVRAQLSPPVSSTAELAALRAVHAEQVPSPPLMTPSRKAPDIRPELVPTTAPSSATGDGLMPDEQQDEAVP